MPPKKANMAKASTTTIKASAKDAKSKATKASTGNTAKNKKAAVKKLDTAGKTTARKIEGKIPTKLLPSSPKITTE